MSNQTTHAPPVPPEQLRRATLGASVGSALEYYDFYVYGLAAALIFPELFFKPLGQDGALMASFATYAVGFAARPVGGLIFGALGDKRGRRFVMLVTIALMGISSILIGVLPTYAQIGIAAPIALVVLRIAQGLGAGAEQAGATVMISEFAPRERRGFFAALPFVGIQLGTLLGAGTFVLIQMAPKQAQHDYLWRVPFLAGVVLIIVAILIRLRLQESPVFTALKEGAAAHDTVPLAVAVKNSGRNILLGIGLRMSENGNSSIYSALLIAFIGGLGIYDDGKSIATIGAAVAAGVAAGTVCAFGGLSDKIGRVTVYRWGAFFQLLIAFPAFYALTLGHSALIIVVIVVGSGLGVQSVLGPQCSLLPELFGNRCRFTGVAAAREFSAVIAGGIAPFVGAALLSAYGKDAWWALGAYSAVLALITFVTTFFTPETRGRDLLDLEDAR